MIQRWVETTTVSNYPIIFRWVLLSMVLNFHNNYFKNHMMNVFLLIKSINILLLVTILLFININMFWRIKHDAPRRSPPGKFPKPTNSEGLVTSLSFLYSYTLSHEVVFLSKIKSVYFSWTTLVNIMYGGF